MNQTPQLPPISPLDSSGGSVRNYNSYSAPPLIGGYGGYGMMPYGYGGGGLLLGGPSVIVGGGGHGLAAAYYFIPKVLGKPIHSYYLSVLGFWSLAIFYNWAGVHHLIGGPVPAWVISAGIAASVMMVVPVAVTAINHHLTMVGNFGALRDSPTLRFVVFGAVNYTLVSLTGSAMVATLMPIS